MKMTMQIPCFKDAVLPVTLAALPWEVEELDRRGRTFGCRDFDDAGAVATSLSRG
jgi:hypothetical protein